ncbi:AEC family transporter [Anaerocolumna xylanovorans]|uniref:Uncharacterized protein n=1 Tax=Anaerocolumna xylanovorans DSM 12503 TaxID=1121345 RepID=A0A1M7Y572_9FIRM|nr:AEC family transporter [Anaerocolumna xylanovorans]SHO47556.1 hypothetical protein SAMN02745217_01575 [Anaerocolumna xylanovorans DSM 12503]
MVLGLVLLRQILIMFLLMGVGFLLYKNKKISMQGNKELGTLLLYIILPASIIKSYITDFTREKLIGLLLSLLMAVIALAISILLSKAVFGNKYRVEHFGAAFSNAGFIGIPLVKAAVGEQGIFYLAAFVALVNILQWTYGVAVMSGSREAISLKKLVTNPIVIALGIGLVFFFLPIKVPAILSDTLSMVAAMTAPVAMITLGVYLGQMEGKELFQGREAYLCTLFRLVAIPLVTFAVLSLFPKEFFDIKLAVLTAAAAPVGSNVAIFAQLNGLKYTDAVKSVALSTIFSIVTIPVILGMAAMVWT